MTEAGPEASLRRDLRALQALGERLQPLRKEFPQSEGELQKRGEASRIVVADAAKLPVVEKDARQAEDAIRVVLEEDSKPLGERIQSLHESLELLFKALKALAVAAWREGGLVGARRFASGQRLVVRATDGAWREAAAEEACNLDGGPASLHPWNHAPLEMSLDAFESLRAWHTNALRAQHSHIVDALSGRRLDALKQCVAIEVGSGEDRYDAGQFYPGTGKPSSTGKEGGAGATRTTGRPPNPHAEQLLTRGLPSVVDVRSLAAWLRTLHQERLLGGEATRPPATLLTAGPASGKSTLLSQLIALSLDSELVPILIKVQLLQQRLISSPDAFATAWNWVDAYLRLEHSEVSPLYRMLRQAMMARRALLLLDGLDEGGTNREQIERHVTEVLAPQGHVLLATSRPAGIDEDRFASFHRLRLSPLTPKQQERALVQRLGHGRSAPLLDYVRERVPIDTETGLRVTANPLMLSMFASVFELRTGLPMPSTVAELYQVASDVMLSRSGAASGKLRRLLQAIFFESQVSQGRVIEDRQLDEAALGLERPEALKAIRERARRHGWAACAVEVRSACDSFSATMRDALAEVRRRVARDELPLLSLLQAEPLQLQSSHLSFQEYFAARALCEEGILSGAPPWKWQASWANTLALGAGMGEPFAKGLKRAAGVGDSLNLCGELGGDRPTALRAVELLSAVLSELQLGKNKIGDKGAKALSSALRVNKVLITLTLPHNNIGAEGAAAIAEALRGNGVLKSLDITGNEIGDEGAKALASALRVNGVLTSLNLSDNALCGVHYGRGSYDASGIQALAEALKVNGVLKQLLLFSNNIGDEGAVAIADGLRVNEALTELDISYNEIGPTGATTIADALKVNEVLATIVIRGNWIGPKGGAAIGEALKGNATLTTLNLEDNYIGDEGGVAIGRALAVNKVLRCRCGFAIGKALEVKAALTTLYVGDNEICDQGAAAIASALRGNAVLTNLVLYDNSIGKEGAAALASALRVNEVLTTLDLRDNDLGDEGKGMIRDAVIGREGFKIEM